MTVPDNIKPIKKFLEDITEVPPGSGIVVTSPLLGSVSQRSLEIHIYKPIASYTLSQGELQAEVWRKISESEFGRLIIEKRFDEGRGIYVFNLNPLMSSTGTQTT